VYEAICEKLIRRHPHVFGDVAAATSADVLKNWEQIKQTEKQGKPESARNSALDGVPRTLPALQRAQRVQEKAANIGFDWAHAADALSKVLEEVSEVQTAAEGENPAALQEELGDLLFSLVNYIRLSGFQAEELAHAATDKFRRRFAEIESRTRNQGLRLQDLSLEEMDAHWNSIKKEHKDNS
jgi:MazG family protein